MDHVDSCWDHRGVGVRADMENIYRGSSETNQDQKVHTQDAKPMTQPIDTMRRLVMIAELVGGERDGVRMINRWDGVVRSIFIPIVRPMGIGDLNDDIEVDMSVLEYQIGTHWCVYQVANHSRALEQVLGEMRDTLYNDRWQVTRYYLKGTR